MTVFYEVYTVESLFFMKKKRKLLLSIEEYKEKGEIQRWPPFLENNQKWAQRRG